VSSPVSEADRTDVEFPAHDGTTLRGWLYVPRSGDTPRPGIVMTHGFSATKEMALGSYADLFCASGLAVLVYDHRCLGASDGEPRQLVDPWAQARDYVAALDWLQAHDGIDPARLGLWGSSFSGGHALVVGAIDERVGAVVANVPFVGRPDEARADDAAFDRLAKGVREHTHRSDDVMGPLPVVTESGMDGAVLPQTEAAEWFLDEGRRTGSRWQNRVLLPGGSSMGDFDPAVAVARLHTPTLLVLASEDRVAPTSDGLAAFELLPGTKELLVIEGHHFTPYAGEALAQSATAALAFYQAWLT
jgi:cephalosporin-C deacetylase-like acetyl esterase